ncbi:MAG: NUDIX hydrolase [Myxococcaceae bacterium]
MADPSFCPQCGGRLAPRKTDDRERLACTACSYVHYDNPTPVVAAIVEMGDSVVLVRNKGWPEKWLGLVTGFLERGESPDAAVLREVKEELGLDAQLVSLIGAYGFAEMNQVIIAYHLRASGEIVLGDELESHKLVRVEKLQPWPFGTGKAVADWLAARRAG